MYFIYSQRQILIYRGDTAKRPSVAFRVVQQSHCTRVHSQSLYSLTLRKREKMEKSQRAIVLLDAPKLQSVMVQSLWWNFCKWSRASSRASTGRRALPIPSLALYGSRIREFLISKDYVCQPERRNWARAAAWIFRIQRFIRTVIMSKGTYIYFAFFSPKVCLPLNVNTFASVDRTFDKSSPLSLTLRTSTFV